MSATDIHELDHRSSDGIDIRLLWSAADGRAVVTVTDQKTGDAFSIEVGAGDNALDVFRHPYAYAAWRRVDTRGGSSPIPLAA